MRTKLLLVATVFFLSGWTWILFKINPFICFISTLLSLLLLDFLNKSVSGFRKMAIFCLALIIIVYSQITSFDRSIYQVQEVERLQITARYQYYFRELGYFYANNRALVHYLNKTEPVVNKYLNNLAKIFDIETYFPTKFPLVFLPFLLVGVYNFLKVSQKLNIIFLVPIILSLGFTNTSSLAGPIILYPLLISFIVFGVMKTIGILR